MILKNRKNKQAGFSMIETVVYLGLFGIIIGGVMVSIYSLFEGTMRNQTKAMVQEEGTYILGKIDWALTGANSVSVSPTGLQLYINRNGINPLDNPLTFDASGGRMTLSRGTSTPITLNNSNIQVMSTVFSHAVESGDGIVPENIKVSFTLSALTPNGQSYSQNFSAVKYLRK